jgi:hypothetical protein
MSYSHAHKRFAFFLALHYEIDEQDVLVNPQTYLGPNYKELLNYWFYMDSLSSEQWNVYKNRYIKLYDTIVIKAYNISKKLSKVIIDSRYIISLDFVEQEIVAAHLYLERNIPFTFPSLIFDL